MIPKLRLDALTDGVFAVAMTLLVIDLKLPEDFHPRFNAELLQRLFGLGHPVLVYVVSFYVLALCWVGHVRSGTRSEEVGQRHVVLALSYLLTITFLPFATSVIGRYQGFPAAIWLYAGNMIFLAVIALRIAMLAHYQADARRQACFGLMTLIAAAVLSVILSFIAPHWAMAAYALNAIEGPLERLSRSRR
jgi:uncharacterized membrane protein